MARAWAESALVDSGVQHLLAVGPDLDAWSPRTDRVAVPVARRIRRISRRLVAVDEPLRPLGASSALGLELQAGPRGPVEAKRADEPLVQDRWRKHQDRPGAEEDAAIPAVLNLPLDREDEVADLRDLRAEPAYSSGRACMRSRRLSRSKSSAAATSRRPIRQCPPRRGPRTHSSPPARARDRGRAASSPGGRTPCPSTFRSPHIHGSRLYRSSCRPSRVIEKSGDRPQADPSPCPSPRRPVCRAPGRADRDLQLSRRTGGRRGGDERFEVHTVHDLRHPGPDNVGGVGFDPIGEPSHPADPDAGGDFLLSRG